MKEHPLYCWTKRELIRPAKKVVRGVSRRRMSRRQEMEEEILEQERELREVRARMLALETELAHAPKKSQEKERIRQATRQRILEKQKVLNVSLTVPDKWAAEETPRKAPRRFRNRARKEARLLFFLLLPMSVTLVYFTVTLLLK